MRHKNKAHLVTLLVLGLCAAPLSAEASEATRVKDINPAGASDPTELRNSEGTLFFTANDGTNGAELWKSNGTESGTVMVRDIRPGAPGSFPRRVANLGGAVFFSADDGVTGFELWRSDGTGGATALLKDVNPGLGGSDPRDLTNANGTVFFAAYVNTIGLELWKSDGTASGTVLVKDLRPGVADSSPTELTPVSGTLFFRADDGLPAANHRELWKSDGTEAGTLMVKDIYPGPGESYPSNLMDFGGTLFFAANDGAHGTELWKSDGTEAGTLMVKDIRPGSGSGGFAEPTVVNGMLFFTADDGTKGKELWKSDGTEAGTVIVKDINPSGSSPIVELTDGNGTLFFAIFDDLWRSDGTDAGTTLVKAFDSTNTYRFELDSLTSVNGTLFFVANDGVHGVEVWRSDGTEAGTVLADDIHPGGAFSFSWPSHLTDVGGELFFQADDGISGAELWSIGPSVPGAVPDGRVVAGSPLRLDKGSGTELTLTWDKASCAAPGTDYAIYEGVLGSFATHVPTVCSTGGAANWTVTPDSGSRYYLVVAIYDGKEGSYGRRSDGAERPQGTAACAVQALSNSCF